MSPRHLLPLAVLGEGALGLAGGLWIYAAGFPVRFGDPLAGIIAGVATAAGLALVQWWALRAAPPVTPVRQWREFYRTVLRPLFGELSGVEIVAISILAGLGEELLFRGAVQPAWGWAAASVAFGLCHVGGRDTLLLGIWATVTGALLGWLLVVTGGLLAPIVAHTVYDALALAYIRWAPDSAEPDGPASADAPAA